MSYLSDYAGNVAGGGYEERDIAEAEQALVEDAEAILIGLSEEERDEADGCAPVITRVLKIERAEITEGDGDDEYLETIIAYVMCDDCVARRVERYAECDAAGEYQSEWLEWTHEEVECGKKWKPLSAGMMQGWLDAPSDI